MVDEIHSAIAQGIPEVHTLTDAATDALWLWLYEQRKIVNPVTKPAISERVTEVRVEDEPVLEVVVDLSEIPRHDSDGRPSWSDVDLDLLEEVDAGQD